MTDREKEVNTGDEPCGCADVQKTQPGLKPQSIGFLQYIGEVQNASKADHGAQNVDCRESVAFKMGRDVS